MDDRTCSIDGCGLPLAHAARQLCSKHNARFIRHGDPLAYKQVSKKVGPCSIPGCERPLNRVAAGLCEMHYSRKRRYGDPLIEPTPPTRTIGVDTCSIPNCGKLVHARGWCAMHFSRWQRNGDPLKTKLLPKGTCSIPGCGRQAITHDWCNRHYQYWRRTGRVATRTWARIGTVTTQGYRIMGWRGHPIAGPSGYVLEHRLVLHDHIGPGAHPCHWCGRIVSWDIRDLRDPSALVVDHVNFDRLDNRPDNLVPSCSPCNSKRSGPS